MNANELCFRREQPADYAAVESMIRESFWNVYHPGCSEHYVMHVLRRDPAFVRELDLVMERDGRLIADGAGTRADTREEEAIIGGRPTEDVNLFAGVWERVVLVAEQSDAIFSDALA